MFILRPKLHNGNWIENEEGIVNSFQNHLSQLFSEDIDIDLLVVKDCIPKVILDNMNVMICKEVYDEEIKATIFSEGNGPCCKSFMSP
ncbi:hypothetical protein V6N12_021132 [Hibiscus sabdariffa]|uniref:Uncharacterized protein n=1 Tax=Hibiscus sabdariffa TaxID=183260 RepID=A0ABR2AUT6_9ROSI